MCGNASFKLTPISRCIFHAINCCKLKRLPYTSYCCLCHLYFSLIFIITEVLLSLFSLTLSRNLIISNTFPSKFQAKRFYMEDETLNMIFRLSIWFRAKNRIIRIVSKIPTFSWLKLFTEHDLNSSRNSHKANKQFFLYLIFDRS